VAVWGAQDETTPNLTFSPRLMVQDDGEGGRVDALARYTYTYKKMEDNKWYIMVHHSSQQPQYQAEEGLVSKQICNARTSTHAHDTFMGLRHYSGVQSALCTCHRGDWRHKQWTLLSHWVQSERGLPYIGKGRCHCETQCFMISAELTAQTKKLAK